MKAGDRAESPSGLGYVVTKVTKREITVEVERVVRRNGKHTVEKHTRVVPAERWDVFASPYKELPRGS